LLEQEKIGKRRRLIKVLPKLDGSQRVKLTQRSGPLH